jgi:hypothetical protein
VTLHVIIEGVPHRSEPTPEVSAMSGPPSHEELDSLKCQLEEVRRECAQLQAENAQFRQLLGAQPHRETSPDEASSGVRQPERPTEPLVTEQSPIEERIALFRNLFRGREDVYPIWWSNQRTGAKGYAPAVKGGWVRRSSGVPLVPTDYLPLTDDVFREHLSGQQSIGIYPLLRDATCWFLACDFDGKQDPAPPTGAQHTGHRNPTAYPNRTRPRGHLMPWPTRPRARTTAFRPISSARAQARAGMCGSFSRARFPPPRHVT